MDIITILLTLVVWGFIFWLLWWAKGQLALGEPFDKTITVVLVIATVVVLIGVLTGALPAFPWLHLR